MLVGGVAWRYAGPVVAERRFLTFETVHPSPRAQGHPSYKDIPRVWAEAYAALSSSVDDLT